PALAICFSLSSASPVRSPKEEYAVTCTSDTPGQETIRHQPEEQQAGLGHDKSELTDKKQLTGWLEEKSWEEQLDIHQEQLEKEMHEARRMVLRLQALLLNGSLPEDDPSGSVSFGDNRANGEQQLVASPFPPVSASLCDRSRELLRHKQEVRHIQAIKDALQQRLSLQEDAVLQLKQELLRSNMAKDQLEGENVVLKNKLSERNTLLGEYEVLCPNMDALIQSQVQDKCGLFYKEIGTHVARNCSRHLMSQGEELQLVREALRSLRDNFSGHDPQHHTLDTLEQGVSSLMDRLHSEAQRRQNRGEFKSPGRRANSSDRDSWPPSSKMAHSHSSPGLDGIVSTKVLYYTDRSLTPFLINLPKRLGEVTLRDFKAAVDRQGSFRYHFKALDPEFGTVKEEVFQDGAVVPGWEGKIVAWVEEDHGERR
uniref:DIX domain containing 1a n=1 Tax=Hippocampus comes TaxID=109280 RepID=A0A3Q2YJ80_HIPCM